MVVMMNKNSKMNVGELWLLPVPSVPKSTAMCCLKFDGCLCDELDDAKVGANTVLVTLLTSLSKNCDGLLIKML